MKTTSTTVSKLAQRIDAELKQLLAGDLKAFRTRLLLKKIDGAFAGTLTAA